MSYVGSTIGNIRIESWLGQGGMGEVYLGYDPRLERRVAVKTIHSAQRLSPVHKARFLREARLLGKLGHPAICQVYDLIESPEADFLILEYIDGMTLRQLAQREILSLERKLDLAAKIADALVVAHKEQIVHRDLKADNVMVTPGGEVKVLDFGVARSLSEPGEPGMIRLVGPPPLPGLYPGEDDEAAGPTVADVPAGHWNAGWSATGSSEDLTRQGVIVGSLQAMSPEQAVGGEITTASDLYSLGILLQELFTGEPAYGAAGQADLIGRVARAETRPIPPESGLDRDLVRFLCDLQSLDPRRRPTAEEAAAELRALRAKPQRLHRQRLRRRVVAAAFALLACGLGLVSWFAFDANRARRESERRRRQAEGLIGFMLDDLRPRLERVNRLDLLDAVGDRALAYFGDLPEGELTRRELLHRAQAIRQIGEVRYAQGNLDAALVAFRRASALAEKLVARAPDLRQGATELSTADTWVGQVLYDQRRTEAALATWREAEAEAERQLRRWPGDPSELDSLASSRHNVGTVLELRGDLAGALQKYRESLALRQEVARRRPGDSGSEAGTAATRAYISNILERQGDLKGALAERRAHLALQEKLLARDPESPDRRYDLAVARGFLAGLLAVRGERAEAREQYESGLALFTTLAAGDPGNALDQRWLGAFHSALGALALAEGDPRGAVAPLGKARALFEPLVAKDPQNPDFRLQLGITHSRAAAALENVDPARARAEAKTAETILAPLAAPAAGEVEEPTRGLLAEAAVTRGRLEAVGGDRESARAAWERALALLAPCRRPITFWKVLSPWVQAELSLDRLEEARPAVERLRTMGFVSREVEELVRGKGLK